MDSSQAAGEVALDIRVGSFEKIKRKNRVSLHVLTPTLRQFVARRRQLDELHDVEVGAVGAGERQLRKQPTTHQTT